MAGEPRKPRIRPRRIIERPHLIRALDNGITKQEIIEVITHLAFYSGWPNAGTAALVAKEVFKERGL